MTDRAAAIPARAHCLTEDEALQYVSARPAETQSEPDLALQGHLDSCDACRVMIAEATRAMTESGVTASRTAELEGRPVLVTPGTPTSLAIGEVLLGRYTIASFVARGGMGEVYEAYDPVLRETLALKTLICTDLDRPAAVQRLMAEVRLARQVTHPNVCRIYEFGLHQPPARPGRDPDPIPFLTMEFLRGESLDRRLARQGPFPAAEVARLIPQLTAGLGAIHAKGIVHRDIKPGNISVLPGPPERLVLMDMGLARAAGPAESGSLSAGRLTGTLDYMAPEQLRGQPATSSIDIYALGLVIFEMLTGQRPFGRADALAAALERMLRPAPRVTQVVSGLDPAWDQLLARCLAPEPDQRFATVEELAAFAAKHLPGRPGGSPWRAGKAAALRSRPLLAAAMLVIVGGVALATWAVKRDRRARPVPGPAAGLAPVTVPAMTEPPWARVRPPQFKARQRAFGPNGCSADMVRVANSFCVDRWESSVVDDLEQRPTSPYYPPSPDLVTKVLADWQRKIDNGLTGAPVPLPELPPWQAEIGWRPVAVSQAQVLPQSFASQIIAAVACANAGKRLCSTEEWRTACRGEHNTKFPYGDSYQQDTCNVRRAEGEHPAYKLNMDFTEGLLDPRMNLMTSDDTGPLLRATGATPTCASRWGDDAVYDMVGNLDEWSSDPNGVILGGFYLRQTQEGCDQSITRHPTDYFNYSLGIRCCDRLR